MKKFTGKLITAKTNKASAVVAMLTLILIVLGCNSAEKPSAPPTEAEAQTLVKNTMSEFTDAVNNSDFAAFKKNASSEFQSQFSDDQLKTSFKDFTDQKTVVVPILRDATNKGVKFSTPPAVREEKGYSVLTTNGTVESDSQPVKINNEYIYQDGKWKLLKAAITLE